MKKNEKPFDAEALLEKLALSSPNDAVKLLFMSEEELNAVEGLDLTLLNEIKRGWNGTVELKFLNKLDIISELTELKNAGSGEIQINGAVTVTGSLTVNGRKL